MFQCFWRNPELFPEMGDHDSSLQRIGGGLDEVLQFGNDRIFSIQSKPMFLDKMIEDELRQRYCFFYQVKNRARTLFTNKGIRIMSGGKQGNLAK